MTDTKHTPWEVRKDLFGCPHVFDAGGDRLTNDRMCGTEGWNDHARLIAAAPDLLEALEALCEQDNSYHGGVIHIPCENHGDAIRKMREARAAIAKARGDA